MKKKVLIIVSIIAGLLLIGGGIFAYFYFRPPTQEEITRYEQILSEGDVFLEAHEYSEAISKYNDSIKVIHTDNRAYSKIVEIYLLKNDYDTALGVADKAQNNLSTSHSSLIYTQIADKYYKNQDYYNARINYEKASTLSSNPSVDLGLAKSHIFNGDVDRAKGLLKGNFDNKTSDEATLLYAYVIGLEDTDKVVNILDDYEVIDSTWTGAYDEYMSVITSLDEDEMFNKAKLSRIYVNNGYPTLAISLLEPVKDDLAQYVDGLFLLGKAYLDNGDDDSAVDTLSSAVSLIGYESQKYWMLARAYYNNDDLVNATLYYDRAIGYAGEEVKEDLVREYLQILIDSNQNNKSQEVFSDIVGNIDEAWMYLLGVELYYNANNDSKVAFYLGKLSQMTLKDNEEMEYLFWAIRVGIGSSDDMTQELEQLLALDRFNSKYYWLNGLNSENNSDNESAIRNYEYALEYDLEGSVTVEIEDLLARLQ